VSSGARADSSAVVFESGRSFDLKAFAANFGGTTVCALEAGTLVFAQGKPADAINYIEDGQVQISVVSRHGKEAIIGILGAGDFCGVGCVLGNGKRATTALCTANSTIVRLERANVLRAVREDAAIAEFFLVHALRSGVQLRDNLISQLLDSSEKRLARTLLLLANYGKKGSEATVIRNVDQEALAQMIGTTRSRVNYFMNKFRKLGYIEYNGSIAVRPALAEEVLHREPPSADAVQASPATLRVSC